MVLTDSEVYLKYVAVDNGKTVLYNRFEKYIIWIPKERNPFL